jgi:hypothetical protein
MYHFPNRYRRIDQTTTTSLESIEGAAEEWLTYTLILTVYANGSEREVER